MTPFFSQELCFFIRLVERCYLWKEAWRKFRRRQSGWSSGATVDTEIRRPLVSAAIRVLFRYTSKYRVPYALLKILLKVTLCWFWTSGLRNTRINLLLRGTLPEPTTLLLFHLSFYFLIFFSTGKEILTISPHKNYPRSYQVRDSLLRPFDLSTS